MLQEKWRAEYSNDYPDSAFEVNAWSNVGEDKSHVLTLAVETLNLMVKSYLFEGDLAEEELRDLVKHLLEYLHCDLGWKQDRILRTWYYYYAERCQIKAATIRKSQGECPSSVLISDFVSDYDYRLIKYTYNLLTDHIPDFESHNPGIAEAISGIKSWELEPKGSVYRFFRRWGWA